MFLTVNHPVEWCGEVTLLFYWVKELDHTLDLNTLYLKNEMIILHTKYIFPIFEKLEGNQKQKSYE